MRLYGRNGTVFGGRLEFAGSPSPQELRFEGDISEWRLTRQQQNNKMPDAPIYFAVRLVKFRYVLLASSRPWERGRSTG